MKARAWDIRLGGWKDDPSVQPIVDTVFFDADMGADAVWRSLVDHDGYDPLGMLVPHYGAAELRALPTLSVGQADDLKVDTDLPRGMGIRVWISRLTVEDGMPYENGVTVEYRVGGRWYTVAEYAADA
jgi:hypothetical protein